MCLPWFLFTIVGSFLVCDHGKRREETYWLNKVLKLEVVSVTILCRLWNSTARDHRWLRYSRTCRKAGKAYLIGELSSRCQSYHYCMNKWRTLKQWSWPWSRWLSIFNDLFGYNWCHIVHITFADIVYALVDAAYDRDKDVRKDMVRSLHELGKQQPIIVLSVCGCYVTKHPKVRL